MSVSKNLREVEARVQTACERAGRHRSEVTLIAVSKFQSNEAIKEAYEQGLRNFAENYVQALCKRREELSGLVQARWHLIGHLQTNKAKAAVANAHVFQALDSERLLNAICNALHGSQKKDLWPVFIEVNIDEEPAKSGISPEETAALVQKVRDKRDLLFLKGLFCVPRVEADGTRTRDAFRRMRELRDSIDPKLELSMGMSSDFEMAVEEGANLIRVGTKIFGERAKR